MPSLRAVAVTLTTVATCFASASQSQPDVQGNGQSGNQSVDAKIVSFAQIELAKRQLDNGLNTSTTTDITTAQTTVNPTTSTAPASTPSAPPTSPSSQPISPPPSTPSSTYVPPPSIQSSPGPTPATSYSPPPPPPPSSPSPSYSFPASSGSNLLSVPSSSVQIPTSSPPGSFSVVSTGSIPVPATATSSGRPVTATSSIPVASVTSGPVISGAGDIVTTDQFGDLITLSGASSGRVYTITAGGHTITTTYNPGATPIRSIAVLTSTLPNGQLSTLTSVAVIVPQSTVFGGAEGQASRTSSGSASLVTGNAATRHRKIGKEAIALVVGAAGVAALL